MAKRLTSIGVTVRGVEVSGDGRLTDWEAIVVIRCACGYAIQIPLDRDHFEVATPPAFESHECQPARAPKLG